ncbi:MAG: ATP-binding cassette domain-containing protein [Burkholderiaceae bacterium]
MTAPRLRVEGLRVAYDGAPPVFDDWSVTLDADCRVALLFGDSGSGKTTLLRVLAGELAASAGRIVVAGRAWDGDREGWRRQVCRIDPSTTAFDAMTPAAFVDQWRDRYPDFDGDDWQRHVDGFGLAPHLGKRFDQLSTGTRRKTWIAASLAGGAPLTLLDEPTAALDRPSIDHLWRSLAAAADDDERPDRLVLVASFDRPPGVRFDAVVALPG